MFLYCSFFSLCFGEEKKALHKMEELHEWGVSYWFFRYWSTRILVQSTILQWQIMIHFLKNFYLNTKSPQLTIDTTVHLPYNQLSIVIEWQYVRLLLFKSKMRLWLFIFDISILSREITIHWIGIRKSNFNRQKVHSTVLYRFIGRFLTWSFIESKDALPTA